MNSKLEAIAEQAATNLRSLIIEGEFDILSAWDAALTEAQAQDEKPKFRLAFAIVLDLDKNQADYDLTWGVRRRLSITAPIPDPQQTTLPLDAPSATVTLKTDTGSVTAPLPAFRAAVTKLRRQAAP